MFSQKLFFGAFLCLCLQVNFLKSATISFESATTILPENEGKLKNVEILLKKGDSKKALESLYDLLTSAKKEKDTTLIFRVNLLLADVYRDNGDYLKSNSLLKGTLPFIKGNYEQLQMLYFKKGGNFQHEGVVDSALVNYSNAIRYGNLVKGKFDLKAKIHANISGIYYLKANYNKSIEHSKIAIDYQRILGNKEIEAGILNNLGSIYYMTGNFKEALSTFQKALAIVGYGQEELQKKTRNSSYINMAYAYSGLGNFEKAFEYQDRYFSLNDSLNQELKYKEITVIEAKYNVERKVKEAELERAKRKEAEYVMYAFGAAILLLLGAVYVFYKLYTLSKKNYMLELEQRKFTHQTRIERIKSEAQSKILAATLDGRLEERRKIASVLHDNISALLSAANLHLYASKKQLKENVPIEIEKSQSIINEASEQIRDLSHDLVSAVLLKFGLSVATQDICEKSSNSTLVFDCNSVNMMRFDQNFELKVFSIISELVNNIIKHSKSSQALIELELRENYLKLVIQDNGIGFDKDNLSSKSGVGLSQIEARVLSLSGELNIDSSELGTKTIIVVPVLY